MLEKDTLGSRIKNAWNVFTNRTPRSINTYELGTSYYGARPDRPRFSYGNERTLTTAIFTRIGIDVSAIKILHVEVDGLGNYKSTVNSGLNYCLTTEANIDQTGRAFIQDIVMSLCDEGSVAVVPVDTSHDPGKTGSFDILSMRTGKVTEWFPQHVKVRLYNDRIGQHSEVILPKSEVAIIENPFYAVMNEPNSTLRRLVHKLSLLDILDNQNSSGKLDLILQLPYVVKTATRKKQAEERRLDIERQLTSSKYGIAYTDGTEKITQLNRPVENTLLHQIENLTSMLYSQLGISESVLNGTANEAEMLNYHHRTLEPFTAAIVNAFIRSFLTKTARTQGKTIMAFNEPFKLVPVSELSTIADRFTRNEILSSNEVRSLIGFPPSEDPGASELRNKNMPVADGQISSTNESSGGDYDKIVEELLSGLESDIDKILGSQQT